MPYMDGLGYWLPDGLPETNMLTMLALPRSSRSHKYSGRACLRVGSSMKAVATSNNVCFQKLAITCHGHIDVCRKRHRHLHFET